MTYHARFFSFARGPWQQLLENAEHNAEKCGARVWKCLVECGSVLEQTPAEAASWGDFSVFRVCNGNNRKFGGYSCRIAVHRADNVAGSISNAHNRVFRRLCQLGGDAASSRHDVD